MLLELTRPVQGGLRQQRKLDVTANNIANASTTGFKRDLLTFDQAFKAVLTVDQTQGPTRETGNPLDFALKDEGYFKVKTPFGVRYTRDGNFMVNREGYLVTQKGDFVLGEEGPIVIPNNGGMVSTSDKGDIRVGAEQVGLFDIVTFDALESLQKEGASYYRYKGDPKDEKKPLNISIAQGVLEGTNVTPVTEMVQMIDEHRMFESYQKVIQSFDETDEKAINQVGKLQ